MAQYYVRFKGVSRHHHRPPANPTLECYAYSSYRADMYAMHKVILPVIVTGLLVGTFVLTIGSSSENSDARLAETPVVAQPDLDCGNSPAGVWSASTNVAGMLCARVTNDAGNDLYIIKGEDYFHARVSGLTPNAPYNFVVRTKKDLLFSVSGDTDIKGDLLMDLSAGMSPRIMARLRGDNKLSFLPGEKGSQQDVIYFSLKGSGDALEMF